MEYARYMKLRDGSWGLRVPDSCHAMSGTVVVAKTAAGAVKNETVGDVLFKDVDGTAVCTMSRNQSDRRRPREPYRRFRE